MAERQNVGHFVTLRDNADSLLYPIYFHHSVKIYTCNTHYTSKHLEILYTMAKIPAYVYKQEENGLIRKKK